MSFDFDSRREVLSVAKLNRRARLLVEDGLGTVWVEGEISNLSRPSSGHMYWSLKDAQAQVRCAMFRQANRRLSVKLADGLQVLVRARVSIYEARGDYQLIVDEVEEAGEGLLRRRFEELKRKLDAEGLFDPARKRELPRLPRRIGVVTSPTGAALRDVLVALRRRFPAVDVLIYPTSVQGDAAPAEICRALELAARRRDCELLILTRGGGSLEDLWAFNDERVARSLAALTLPVIVGVGHEIDFTIADFVADLRAPTPSQAAELAVPDRAEWLSRLGTGAGLLLRAMRDAIAARERSSAVLAHRLKRAHPGVTVRNQHQRVDELEARLRHSLKRQLDARRVSLAELGARVAAANPRHRLGLTRERWRRAQERLHRGMQLRLTELTRRLDLATRGLESLSPLATLERGYAIVARAEDAAVLTDSAAVAVGTSIDVRLARGRLAARVERTEPAEDRSPPPARE